MSWTTDFEWLLWLQFVVKVFFVYMFVDFDIICYNVVSKTVGIRIIEGEISWTSDFERLLCLYSLCKQLIMLTIWYEDVFGYISVEFDVLSYNVVLKSLGLV